MTKSKLQQELKEKVKPGIKPSDLKKQRQKQVKKPISPSPISISEDEGYSSEELSEEEEIIVPIVPTSNLEIKNLKTEIKALQRQLQTYKDFKAADLKIKEKLKGEIAEYKETIRELQAKIQEQDKTISELKEQVKNTAESKGEVKANPQEAEAPESSNKYYLFTCDICEQNKRSKLHFGKVNGLGIDPLKNNKICDWCINKVDLIKDTEQEYKFE